jgi:uncharacterized phage-associated protein
MPFTFSHRKATQALNFFARRAGGRIRKLKALKLVYFADRYHLRRFGRPVTGDAYLAMNYGPVASATKDIAEMSDFLNKEEHAYATRFVRPLDQYVYESKAAVDESVFSESDREALAWAWTKFGRMAAFRLARLTHQYPEWQRHEKALTSEAVSRAPMNYRDFLEDPPRGVEPCHPLTAGEREAVAAGIEERAGFERLWR